MKKNKIMKSIVGVYATHDSAVNAITYLKNSGYPVNQISLVSKADMVNNQIGFKTGDIIEQIELGIGVAIGAIIGILTGVGIFVIPGLGMLYGAGAVTGVMAGLELGLLGSGITVILTEMGIEKNNAYKYEQHINDGKFLVFAQGEPNEIDKASDILFKLGSHVAIDRN